MSPSQKLFSTHPHLRARWDAVGRKLAFDCRTRQAHRAWRRRTVRKLRELLGLDTMTPTALRPRVTEERDCGSHVRQRVEIRTEPGVVMPMYVLIPKAGRGPFPAVIAAHGHGGGGKVAVAGCREVPGVAERIAKYNYDYGVGLVEAGFIVFCPDARGFGERREEIARRDPFQHCCQWLNHMAIPLGQTVMGMWVWDLMRLVDYIAARRDCARGLVGCAGLSGGGLQTLWAAALDERIRAAAVSGYFYGSRQSLLDGHANCSCNYVPHLWEHADMGDVAALIAPRPFLVETGDADPLNGAAGLANVRSQLRIARGAYRLLGAPGGLRHAVFAGGHRWNGAAIPWLRRHLAAGARKEKA
ncbi:MAG TPA: alpha/beta hydrolase family protein [Planctomycetota bacterium]|nr:alpha/beta hydrolase family protein [Planctomycetota bacterium]